MPNYTLPGYSTVFKDGGLNFRTAADITQDGVLLIGTAEDGPVDTPAIIGTLQDGISMFGDSLDKYGVDNGTTLIKGMKDSFNAGARNITLVRIGGEYAFRELKATGYEESADLFSDTGVWGDTGSATPGRFPATLYQYVKYDEAATQYIPYVSAEVNNPVTLYKVDETTGATTAIANVVLDVSDEEKPFIDTAASALLGPELLNAFGGDTEASILIAFPGRTYLSGVNVELKDAPRYTKTINISQVVTAGDPVAMPYVFGDWLGTYADDVYEQRKVYLYKGNSTDGTTCYEGTAVYKGGETEVTFSDALTLGEYYYYVDSPLVLEGVYPGAKYNGGPYCRWDKRSTLTCTYASVANRYDPPYCYNSCPQSTVGSFNAKSFDGNFVMVDTENTVQNARNDDVQRMTVYKMPGRGTPRYYYTEIQNSGTDQTYQKIALDCNSNNDNSNVVCRFVADEFHYLIAAVLQYRAVHKLASTKSVPSCFRFCGGFDDTTGNATEGRPAYDNVCDSWNSTTNQCENTNDIQKDPTGTMTLAEIQAYWPDLVDIPEAGDFTVDDLVGVPYSTFFTSPTINPRDLRWGETGTDLYDNKQRLFTYLQGTQYREGLYSLVEHYPYGQVVVPLAAYISDQSSGANDFRIKPEDDEQWVEVTSEFDETPTTSNTEHIDFATQLVRHCYNASINGAERIGVMCYGSLLDTSMRGISQRVDELIEDDSIIDQGFKAMNEITGLEEDIGRYLVAVAGPDAISTGTGRPTTPEAFVGGLLGALPPMSNITGKELPNVDALTYNFSSKQHKQLGERRYVALSSLTGVVTCIDGVTCAQDIIPYVQKSDYTRISTVRVVHDAVRMIRRIARPFIGEPNSLVHRVAMETMIGEGLSAMEDQGAIRRGWVTIISTPQMQIMGDLIIQLTIAPYGEIRKIMTFVELTPGI